MDPLTLFALANGAVSAVKAGCKLYKDIKGAAGDVKDVLKDLDAQFHKAYEGKGKTPSPEAVKQLKEEKARVVELNKKANSNEHTNIYSEIGEELGKYYDNYYKCIAVFEQEEKRSKTEIYTGDASLGKRALQRVLMRKQLEQMGTELQEIMIYQSPPELGALWTEVNQMMKKMGDEQKVLVARHMDEEYRREQRRKKRMERLHIDIAIGLAGVTISVAVGLMFVWIINDRIEKYPHLGTDWIPKTEEQRKRDAEPKIWTGR